VKCIVHSGGRRFPATAPFDRSRLQASGA
jgi:hypothetical protein